MKHKIGFKIIYYLVILIGGGIGVYLNAMIIKQIGVYAWAGYLAITLVCCAIAAFCHKNIWEGVE